MHKFWFSFHTRTRLCNGLLRRRLRIVPLSLSRSCVTRKKTARKKWPREILGARRVLLAPRRSRGHFFIAVFFREMRNSRVHVSDCFCDKQNIVHLVAYTYMLTSNEEIPKIEKTHL